MLDCGVVQNLNQIELRGEIEVTKPTPQLRLDDDGDHVLAWIVSIELWLVNQ